MIRKALREWLQLLLEGLQTAPAPLVMAHFTFIETSARSEVESGGRATQGDTLEHHER